MITRESLIQALVSFTQDDQGNPPLDAVNKYLDELKDNINLITLAAQMTGDRKASVETILIFWQNFCRVIITTPEYAKYLQPDKKASFQDIIERIDGELPDIPKYLEKYFGFPRPDAEFLYLFGEDDETASAKAIELYRAGKLDLETYIYLCPQAFIFAETKEKIS